MTRVEMRDEIVRRSEPDIAQQKRARGFLGVARDLVASVVEAGLNLPDAAALIRGDGNREAHWKGPPPVATVTLAEIYAAQGHLDRALRMLDEVLAKEPDHDPARALRARLASATDLPVAPARRRQKISFTDNANVGVPANAPDLEPVDAVAPEPAPAAAVPASAFEPAPPPAPAAAIASPPEPDRAPEALAAVAADRAPEPLAAVAADRAPEPLAAIASDPEPAPVAAVAADPEPAPVAAIASDPEPAPVAAVAAEPEPAPVATVEAEPEPAPAPVAAVAPEPEPAAIAALAPAAIHPPSLLTLSLSGQRQIYWELPAESLTALRAHSPSGHPVVRVISFRTRSGRVERHASDLTPDSEVGFAVLPDLCADAVVRAVLGWQAEGRFMPYVVASDLPSGSPSARHSGPFRANPLVGPIAHEVEQRALSYCSRRPAH
jgi:hypothetical protein